MKHFSFFLLELAAESRAICCALNYYLVCYLQTDDTNIFLSYNDIDALYKTMELIGDTDKIQFS